MKFLQVQLVKREIPFPVILFLDGQKTHMGVEALKFCDEKQIHLYRLPPNCTNIMQPLDVCLFSGINEVYNKCVKEF